MVTCWKIVQFFPMTAPTEMKTPLIPCGNITLRSSLTVRGRLAPNRFCTLVQECPYHILRTGFWVFWYFTRREKYLSKLNSPFHAASIRRSGPLRFPAIVSALRNPFISSSIPYFHAGINLILGGAAGLRPGSEAEESS
jgi:hypothetical protein